MTSEYILHAVCDYGLYVGCDYGLYASCDYGLYASCNYGHSSYHKVTSEKHCVYKNVYIKMYI